MKNTAAEAAISFNRAIVRVDSARDVLTPLLRPETVFRKLSTGEAKRLRQLLDAADSALRDAYSLLANAIDAVEQDL